MARRALKQKQLQSAGSPPAEADADAPEQGGRPTSVGMQWAQAAQHKTPPPDTSSRGATPLAVLHPLRRGSSPSMCGHRLLTPSENRPFDDPARSASALTQVDGAFTHSASAHRLDSSASLGALGAASSHAQVEAQHFRPKAMGGIAALGLHSSKMTAPPALISAFDGQYIPRHNSVALW